jgi:hypothetical protein
LPAYNLSIIKDIPTSTKKVAAQPQPYANLTDADKEDGFKFKKTFSQLSPTQAFNRYMRGRNEDGNMT